MSFNLQYHSCKARAHLTILHRSYINKLTLYHQAIWECERTGKTNLTYEQALESERNEHERAEYHFSEVLRKSILNQVQFRKYNIEQCLWISA